MHDGAKTARRTLAYAMLHPVLKLKLLDVILYINKQTKVKRILCVSLSTYDFFLRFIQFRHMIQSNRV